MIRKKKTGKEGYIAPTIFILTMQTGGLIATSTPQIFTTDTKVDAEYDALVKSGGNDDFWD